MFWNPGDSDEARSEFRRKHLKPLLEAGLVRMTNPDRSARAEPEVRADRRGGRAEGEWMTLSGRRPGLPARCAASTFTP